jgi:hypothetical protein
MSNRTINLDVARAARAEASGEPVIVVFHGAEYRLPVELPIEAATRANEPLAFLEVLLRDSYTQFMDGQPSMQDVLALAEGIARAYGFETVPN